MNSIIKGKVWKFGDDIDTDIIIPGRYLTLRDPDEMASHAFEPIDPEFSKKVNARQEIEIDLSNGTLKNLESQETFKYAPIPNFLMDILAAGGAIEAIKKRIKK